MPMPKGFKSNNGYSTITDIEGGNDFRTIAEHMTDMGFKMNHATARNVLLSSLQKLAKTVHEVNDVSYTREDLKIVAKDPQFQAGIAEILETLDWENR